MENAIRVFVYESVKSDADVNFSLDPEMDLKHFVLD